MHGISYIWKKYKMDSDWFWPLSTLFTRRFESPQFTWNKKRQQRRKYNWGFLKSNFHPFYNIQTHSLIVLFFCAHKHDRGFNIATMHVKWRSNNCKQIAAAFHLYRHNLLLTFSPSLGLCPSHSVKHFFVSSDKVNIFEKPKSINSGYPACI